MKPETRRFTIADIMIFVPAAAVGTLILRSYMPGHMRQIAYYTRNPTDPWGLWRCYGWATGPGSCVVVPMMAALIVARLRRPRPRYRRLIDQPGFVACLAVMASLLPGLVWIATIVHRPGFQRVGGFEQSWAIATNWVDTAVVGSWIALGLSRRWRPEASWIDRVGIALGAYWVLLVCATIIIPWVLKIQQSVSLGGAP